ncbi:hypothetical protein IWX64_003200 [Arthrobacter sp. CAN_A212]
MIDALVEIGHRVNSMELVAGTLSSAELLIRGMA